MSINIVFIANRTIPLTEEAVEILKLQKQKNRTFKVIPMEWADIVLLCKKGTPVKNSTYDTMLFKFCRGEKWVFEKLVRKLVRNQDAESRKTRKIKVFRKENIYYETRNRWIT